MTYGIKVKPQEMEKLAELGFKEFQWHNNIYLYMIDAKRHSINYSFKKQVTKTLKKNGVEFLVDSNSEFKTYGSFKELIDALSK